MKFKDLLKYAAREAAHRRGYGYGKGKPWKKKVGGYGYDPRYGHGPGYDPRYGGPGYGHGPGYDPRYGQGPGYGYDPRYPHGSGHGAYYGGGLKGWLMRAVMSWLSRRR